MEKSTLEMISRKYCPRFGQIAVQRGYITDEQLKQALCLQVEGNLAGEKHRLIGTILFDLDMMTTEQIEEVLNILFTNQQGQD